LGDICVGAAPTLEDFAVLERRSALYDRTLVQRVRACLAAAGGAAREVRRVLPTARLLPGMHLAEDVVSKVGQLVLAGQTLLAEAHIERLRQLAKYQYIVDAVSVVSGQEPMPKQ